MTKFQNQKLPVLMRQIMFSIVLVSLAFAAISPAQSASDDRAEKARQAAATIGTGEKATVEVKLRDGTKLNGYIASASADSLTLMEKSGASRTVPFSDVDQLKRRRGGLSTAAWIGIAAAAAGGAVLIGIISIRCRNEPGTC